MTLTFLKVQVYIIPVTSAAVTNYHKLSGLEQHKFIIAGGEKSKVGLMGQKSGC